MHLFNRLCIVLVLAVSFVLCSCSSTKKKPVISDTANVTNESYSWGTYKADFPVSMGQLDKAIRRTCARARLIRDEQNFRTTSVEYKFHDIETIPIVITIKELPDNEGTQIMMKIDRWGDKEASKLIINAIDEELKLITSTPQK